jgi:hypothetical protein
MNILRLPAVSLIVLGLLVSMPASAADKAQDSNPGAKPTTMRAPMYVPPKRGAPASRVGGGTRGAGDGAPKVLVLAPEHTGLTISEQPTLYWYLSKTVSNKLEVSVSNDESLETVLELTLDSPEQAGIQAIDLSKHGVKLKPDVEYRWFVALIPDDTARSNDIIAGGTIMRIAEDAGLQSKLSSSKSASDKAVALAQQGIWYDAIDTLSVAIDKTGDQALKQQRADLLAQVGLQEAAR